MTPTVPTLHWHRADGQAAQALWRCERGSAPPTRVLLADDTWAADAAYRAVRDGAVLLWQGDFNNARHLLQALQRRLNRAPARQRRQDGAAAHAPPAAGQAFHLHRQQQAQRARVLGAVLIPLQADYRIPLRRAPDVRLACCEAWGPPAGDTGPASVLSLRQLLGLISAHEWRKKGVPVPALGPAPDGGVLRIHPHYGLFSPVRGEYVQLVAQAPLPPAAQPAPGCPAPLALDLGTGTGVLAAVLARRGLAVLATDIDQRALACAQDNLQRLGWWPQVRLLQADGYPGTPAAPAGAAPGAAPGVAPGAAPDAVEPAAVAGPASSGPDRFALVVCNPPWLPVRPGSPLERTVYDEDSRLLRGFLAGLAMRLAPGGEGWLILSDLAEHLGLRTRAELLQWVDEAGLQVAGRVDTRPQHRKAFDAADPLHAARAAELTSLWRLVPRLERPRC